MGADDGDRKSDRVFVVHGRNEEIRNSMFSFLGALGLKPIEWDHAVELTGKGSPYVGEILDAAFGAGQAVVVLMTPDDIAYVRSEYASGDDDTDKKARGQARPNVLFEAGMAMGRNEDHTILVEFGDLRPFSDVGGRHTVRLDNTPQRRKSLAQRLKTAGCPVDLTGDHWMKAGNFTLAPLAGELPMGRKLVTNERRGPHVDGSWIAGSGSRMDILKVTNNGALPLFSPTVVVPAALADHVQLWQDDSIPKLPVGKTLTIRAFTSNRGLGGSAPNQFELIVAANLEDGTPFEQEIYLDTVG
ncbi:nucleotide-binding protein [Cryobacterium sp. 10S3]|uniref:nucleotide-binding protein n=1 Tax=Cryobacterium sp. 10S3 TaxID=3048582 RepID=UPI002AC98B5F|nr:nucleotide-binding protein [Cryobacterium sp. 10S3]MEB0288497.1 nucleotide-binding protein [Cryobacterium sp. 10S3]WPX13141.1 nucleotide-binding protein [Cryobacterium sp. 10S3]